MINNEDQFSFNNSNTKLKRGGIVTVIILLALSPFLGFLPIIILAAVLLQYFGLKNKKIELRKGNFTLQEIWEQINAGTNTANSKPFSSRSDSRNKIQNNTDLSQPVKKVLDIKDEQPYKVEKTSKKWIVVFVIIILAVALLWYLNSLLLQIVDLMEMLESPY